MRAAMLFAWADDISTQKEIMTLNAESEITYFLSRQQKVIFVIDQINALKDKDDRGKKNLLDWLMHFTVAHKSVFSSSANYADYHEQAKQQNSNNFLTVYGGLERVSHRKLCHNEASNSTRLKWTSGGSDIEIFIWQATRSLKLKTSRAASHCS
jgi:hypothetical protein